MMAFNPDPAAPGCHLPVVAGLSYENKRQRDNYEICFQIRLKTNFYREKPAPFTGGLEKAMFENRKTLKAANIHKFNKLTQHETVEAKVKYVREDYAAYMPD